MPKKSYMNTDNILSEGLIDKVMKLLSVGKYKQVKNMFKKDPNVQKAIKDLEKADANMKVAMKNIKSKYGIK